MNELENLIRRSLPPAPPPGLRNGVLAAATAGRREPPPWWWRPAVRWAWAGITAVLLAANLSLIASRPRRERAGRTRPAASPAIDDPLLAGELATSQAERPAPAAAAAVLRAWMKGWS